jgi:Fe-S-cluster containining protein
MRPDTDEKVTATVQLTVAGHDLTIEMNLPTRRVRPGELLPLYRGLAEHLVQAGVANVRSAGHEVSCRKGCGACCRQLVPISETEARRIREVIDELPADRQKEIRGRFADARRQLQEAGLLAGLGDRSLVPLADRVRLGIRYFAEGIPCPFLEDEACSIYEERPIACREYLVTSPPANCSQPTRESVATVPVPGRVSAAVRWLTAPADAAQPAWVPLILAPDWAEANPEPAPTRTGPELARALFERLTGDEVPPEA